VVRHRIKLIPGPIRMGTNSLTKLYLRSPGQDN
jgi:hypothetical protein